MIPLLIALALPLPAGKPAIVVPMYVRCPSACLTITRNMKKAAAKAHASPDSYNVVLFSFDPRDTPADMRGFAEREKVPANWTLITATPDQITTLIDTIGFRYMQQNGGFAHPSVAAVFTSDLRFVKVMSGNALDVDEALALAHGGRDWIGQFGGYALAFLLFACTVSAIYLFSPRERRLPC